MTLLELLTKLAEYRNGKTGRAWKMTRDNFYYANDYIKYLRTDSSNHWISETDMEKQWSIIIEMKKDISSLERFHILCQNERISLTPVRKGKNKGAYGIRVYGMRKDPDVSIVTDIFNYIFGE